MSRLLTGCAVAFHHRHDHNRSGHLFQNQDKSIICLDDLYLLELVRYIHLNPLRARLVDTVEDPSDYGESGHRQLLSLTKHGVVAVDDILSLIRKKRGPARRKYAAFIADGADQGKRPDLVGGGLRRSLAGGLSDSNAFDERMMSDERVLGEGAFVEEILPEAESQLSARQHYQVAGFDLEALSRLVAELLEINPTQVMAEGKQPEMVRARSLPCY